jgi:hypothetical protein
VSILACPSWKVDKKMERIRVCKERSKALSLHLLPLILLDTYFVGFDIRVPSSQRE